MRTVVQTRRNLGVLERSGISSKLRDLICKKHTVRPSDLVLSRFTLSKQWAIILFDVSRLTMLKKDTPIASGVVVESEWVDL